jgi:tRNA (adenine37-N6)-methyltransferase
VNAILIVNEPRRAAGMSNLLRERGFTVAVTDDTELVLRDCREHPPNLVIVENSLGKISGIRFLSELVRISWTTSTVLVSDEDPETIHDRTEGLGILGSVTSLDDREGMERLLTGFFELMPNDRTSEAPQRDGFLMDEIRYRPIGVIRSPFTDVEGMPIQPNAAKGTRGTVELNPDLEPGLKDLDGFSHLVLLYHFHLSRGYSLEVKPFLDDKLRGVFSTRAPRRPNALGLSVVRLLRIKGYILEIQDVDVLDGTPLLDIKPFVPNFDNREAASIGWLGENIGRSDRVKADGRFKDASED